MNIEAYLEVKKRAGSELSLDSIKEVDEAFGFPSKQYRTIHVTGTNGKGSVSTTIATTLTSQGYKTGLFTSPHISTFRERIVIDGEMISETDALSLLNEILEVSKMITFFEVMTMMAFLYFQRKQVDYAVIEVGMGGDKDATNIIEPIVSVLTNITSDHLEILGPTLDDVAKTKAGIIKRNVPVVIGPRAARKPVLARAFQQKAPIYFVKEFDQALEENQAIAHRALKVINPYTDFVLSTKVPPCRFELHTIDKIPFIFDVAHNIDGLERLFFRVKETFPTKKIFTIFALSAGKDLENIIPLLSKESDDLYFMKHEHPRLARKEEIENHLGFLGDSSIEAFIEKAREENGIVLITGTFFIMGPMKKILGLEEIRDPILLYD